MSILWTPGINGFNWCLQGESAGYLSVPCVLLILIIVGQGPTVLAVGAGAGGLDIFSLNYQVSFLSPSIRVGWV